MRKGVELSPNNSQEPWAFAFDLIKWADGKGVSLRQDSVGAILNAKFVPENVSTRTLQPFLCYQPWHLFSL